MDKCPQCGYTEAQVQHMKSNVMNHYVNSLTGKPDGIYNSEEVNIEVKGVKLTLQSKWVAPKTPDATKVPAK